MRATVIDHVIVHGLTIAEAGLRVCPNLRRFSVTIIQGIQRTQQVLYCIVVLVTTVDLYRLVEYYWLHLSRFIAKHVC